MSKLYLRNTTNNTAGYAGTEKSTALPVGTLDDAGNGARDLETTKGAAETSVTNSSLAQTAHQDQYMGKWISDPLTVSTVDANTWTLAIVTGESNPFANCFTVASVYVLKSDDTVRGFVYDSDTPLGVEWISKDGQVLSLTGSAVSGVVSTDRLVVEIWAHAEQGMATSATNTVFFDGTTDVVDTTDADAASYLETPQDLFAVTGPQSIAVGIASETETAKTVAVVSAISVAVTNASETETAKAITAVSVISVSVGTATETESAKTVSVVAGAVSIAVGTASETETAKVVGITSVISVSVGVASETETAKIVTVDAGAGPQTIAVGVAIETETAKAITVGSVISIAVGLATETETASAVVVAGAVSIAVGVATETETAKVVEPVAEGGPQSIAVALALELETAKAVAVLSPITVAVGAASETETAQTVTAVAGAVLVSVGVATETETAGTVTVSQTGVTFWSPNPVAFTKNPVAYVPVGPDDDPPW